MSIGADAQQITYTPADMAGPATVLVTEPGVAGRRVVIRERLFIGRECAGIPAPQRLLVDDPEISREHAEIRVEADGSGRIVDTSANGTRVNGVRLERGTPSELLSGDVVSIGRVSLEFHSGLSVAGLGVDLRATVRRSPTTEMVLVVGDVINYSGIAERSQPAVLAGALEVLFGGLQTLLRTQRGTLANYAGDAFLGVWEIAHQADCAERAVDFALAASELVGELAPRLEVTDPWGGPLRMGWGVVRGAATVSSLTGQPMAVVGDTTNVAFRISSLAGRDGRAPVLVSDAVAELLQDTHPFGEPEVLALKGRERGQTVFGLGSSTMRSPQ